jgi:hypothetical protein
VFDFLQNPSFFDHFKKRFENKKTTLQNKKDLTPDLGGQFGTTNYCQDL